VTASSLPELLLNRAAASPRTVAVRTSAAGVWQEAGWSDVVTTVARAAHTMRSAGVAAGSVVVLVCGSRPEWPIAVLAAQSLGATVVALAGDATPDALAAVRSTHRCSLRVVEGEEQFDHVVAAGAGTSPMLVVDHRGIDLGSDEIRTWQAAIVDAADPDDAPALERLRADVAALDPDQPAAVIPRDDVSADGPVAVWTHRQLAGDVGHPEAGAPSGAGLVEGDEYLSFLPPAWPVESFALLREAPMVGATTSFGGRVGGVLGDLRDIQPTVIQAPGELWDAIASEVVARTADAGRLTRGAMQGVRSGRSRPLASLARRAIRSKTGLSRVRSARSLSPVAPETVTFLEALGVALAVVPDNVHVPTPEKEPTA
jgi:long-chain acyl-CoA synthetase